jgi:16S rRNA (cytidine1402-2'-O)-methyltransferase
MINLFEGFLPEKKGRQTRYLELAEETRTIILYVSPHKLVKTLAEFITYFERIVKFVFQENCLNYTKKTEEVLLKKYSLISKKNRPRGEIVVVVAGKTIEKEAKKIKKRKNKA